MKTASEMSPEELSEVKAYCRDNQYAWDFIEGYVQIKMFNKMWVKIDYDYVLKIKSEI